MRYFTELDPQDKRWRVFEANEDGTATPLPIAYDTRDEAKRAAFYLIDQAIERPDPYETRRLATVRPSESHLVRTAFHGYPVTVAWCGTKADSSCRWSDPIAKAPECPTCREAWAKLATLTIAPRNEPAIEPRQHSRDAWGYRLPYRDD